MPHQIFEFGSIYLDNMPQRIPQNPCFGGDIPHHMPTSPIRIGQTAEGRRIPWVKPDGMNLLIADRVLLADVSWQQLRLEDLIYRMRRKAPAFRHGDIRRFPQVSRVKKPANKFVGRNVSGSNLMK